MFALYADRQGWGRKAILNVARSALLSSDRTITEYAGSIWGANYYSLCWPGPSGAGEVS